MKMQKKLLSMFLVVLFLSVPAGAMFKPSTMMRYVSSFKWLKSQNTKNFFQTNVGKKNLLKSNIFSKNNNFNFSNNNFNSKVDWRWSLPFFGAGLFFDKDKLKLDSFIAQLEADDFIFDGEARSVLATDIGQQAVVDYVLKNPLKVIESKDKFKLVNKLIKKNQEVGLQLVPFVLENYKDLLKSEDGCSFLASMCDVDVAIVQTIGEGLVNFLKNPLKVIESEDRLNLINKLIKLNPRISVQLIPFTLENYKKLFELSSWCSSGHYFLSSMCDLDIKIARVLTEWLVNSPESWDFQLNGYYSNKNFRYYLFEGLCQNFTTLIKTDAGRNLLKDFISLESEDRLLKKLESFIVANLDVYLSQLPEDYQENCYVLDFLGCLLTHRATRRVFSDKSQDVWLGDILDYAENNIEKFFKRSDGALFLYNMITLSVLVDNELYLQDQERIVNLVKSNKTDFINFIDWEDLLGKIVRMGSGGIKFVLELALKNLDKSPELLLPLIDLKDIAVDKAIADALKEPQAAQCLIGYCKNNKPNARFVYKLRRFIPDLELSSEEINNALACKNATFDDVVNKLSYLNDNVEERELNPLTATESHLLDNFEGFIDSDMARLYFNTSALKKMDYKLHNKIRELENDGYITFVHGQRLDNLLVENWFTRLQGLKKKKSFSEFLYAHVKGLDADKQIEKELRERLLKNGRSTEYDRSRLLFLNGALLGNTTNPGSSTRYYTIVNDNVGPRYACLEDAFKNNFYERFYQKYEGELKELEEEFSTISEYGNTLLIGVPKDQLSKCVFSAMPGGYKKLINIQGVGQTSDIDLIMHTLKYEPHKISDTDKMEFCLVMTQDKDGGLNPKSGIKVYSYVALKDEKKYQEFQKKENRLWQKIAGEIDDSTNNEYYLNLYSGDA